MEATARLSVAVLCPFCGQREGTIEAQENGRPVRVCAECLAFACLSPAEKRKREAQGRKAARDASRANRGIPTEQRARESAERMAAAGIAWLDKIPTNWKPCGRRGAFVQCIPQEKAIVDFVGHDAEGYVVAVEVKSDSTPDARFYLSSVPEQQRAYLDHVSGTPLGRAYLLVDFPALDAWYLVPWRIARDWVRVAPEDTATQAYLADREMFMKPRGME